MKIVLRLCLCLLVGGSLAGLLAATVPLIGGPSLVSSEQLEQCRLIVEELTRQESITTRDAAVRLSIEEKGHIVEDLIAEKLTLAEAVDRFAQLQALMDDGQDYILGPYHGVAHGDEALCNMVLNWVGVQMHLHPNSTRVMARLLEQKREYLAKSRTVHAG